MDVRERFEEELRRRGLDFDIDPESQRHTIKIGDNRLLVSLENLLRDVADDGDLGRISRFVDAVIESSEESEAFLSAGQLYWCLEPNDYEVKAGFRVEVSDRVDRVLVHLSSDGSLITWVTRDMLEALAMEKIDAGQRAFENLARALEGSSVEWKDIEGVKLGFIGTSLPFKAALLLAPNLREVVGAKLGWPLLAVVPDRDFIYLWSAEHSGFASRLGHVVVREYSKAAYPISAEVYEASDEGIRAIGEFPTK